MASQWMYLPSRKRFQFFPMSKERKVKGKHFFKSRALPAFE